jgi:hypothetical protein
MAQVAPERRRRDPSFDRLRVWVAGTSPAMTIRGVASVIPGNQFQHRALHAAMWKLIDNRDLKTLFEGVAGVAAAGLLMGMAMHPQLDAREISGPQMLAPSSGIRLASTEIDPGVAVYKGRVPDYVYGTDWTKLPVAEYPEAAPTSEAYAEDAADTVEDASALPVTHATWREPPREPTVYPSMSGDTAYPSEAQNEPDER